MTFWILTGSDRYRLSFIHLDVVRLTILTFFLVSGCHLLPFPPFFFFFIVENNNNNKHITLNLPPQLFLVYGSVVSSIFSLFYCRSPELFHVAKLKLYLLNSKSSPEPLVITLFLSVSMILTTSDVPYEWDHGITEYPSFCG